MTKLYGTVLLRSLITLKARLALDVIGIRSVNSNCRHPLVQISNANGLEVRIISKSAPGQAKEPSREAGRVELARCEHTMPQGPTLCSVSYAFIACTRANSHIPQELNQKLKLFSHPNANKALCAVLQFMCAPSTIKVGSR